MLCLLLLYPSLQRRRLLGASSKDVIEESMKTAGLSALDLSKYVMHNDITTYVTRFLEFDKCIFYFLSLAGGWQGLCRLLFRQISALEAGHPTTSRTGRRTAEARNMELKRLPTRNSTETWRASSSRNITSFLLPRRRIAVGCSWATALGLRPSQATAAGGCGDPQLLPTPAARP